MDSAGGEAIVVSSKLNLRTPSSISAVSEDKTEVSTFSFLSRAVFRGVASAIALRCAKVESSIRDGVSFSSLTSATPTFSKPSSSLLFAIRKSSVDPAVDDFRPFSNVEEAIETSTAESSASLCIVKAPWALSRSRSASRSFMNSSPPFSFKSPILLQCSSSAISSQVLNRSKPSGSISVPHAELSLPRSTIFVLSPTVTVCFELKISSIKSGTCCANMRSNVPR